MGAVLNGFSLNESGPLAAAIEKTGQAVDATYLSTTALVCNTELTILIQANSIAVTLVTGA